MKAIIWMILLWVPTSLIAIKGILTVNKMTPRTHLLCRFGWWILTVGALALLLNSACGQYEELAKRALVIGIAVFIFSDRRKIGEKPVEETQNES
ncbi:MAG: hypothetical protein K2Y28_08495 [Burkholderiaceae bacterium]|nr:hypothetical protein [Burkholderiaceae bacterium]